MNPTDLLKALEEDFAVVFSEVITPPPVSRDAVKEMESYTFVEEVAEDLTDYDAIFDDDKRDLSDPRYIEDQLDEEYGS